MSNNEKKNYIIELVEFLLKNNKKMSHKELVEHLIRNGFENNEHKEYITTNGSGMPPLLKGIFENNEYKKVFVNNDDY